MKAAVAEFEVLRVGAALSAAVQRRAPVSLAATLRVDVVDSERGQPVKRNARLTDEILKDRAELRQVSSSSR